VYDAQWWEKELERAYVLYKARRVHEETAIHLQQPALGAPVPAYLSSKFAHNKALPVVEVVASQEERQPDREEMEWEGRRTSEPFETGEGSDEEEEEEEERDWNASLAEHYAKVRVVEEEMAAVVSFVAKDLNGHLYTELLQGFK
jgi:hypothetical protein